MQARTLFDVTGQVALVTGAASGLGLAMAEVMAANGAHVVMTDVDATALDGHAARLKAEGAAVEAVVLNAADRQAVRREVAAAAERHGRLDAVFANAGMSAGSGPLTDAGQLSAVSDERWDQVVALNLGGVFATIQAASAPMRRQRRGRIVVTASIAGLRADVHCGYAYATTKAAVAHLVRQAAMELAPHNVMVNAIAPGPFLTNIAGGRLRDPAVVASFAQRVPLGRIADTEEIKGLALLLASPASSFMTGTVIPIDGGTSI